ncbi:MAG: hypothetical protein AAGF95_06380 [Chloroflexota bacterium]
MGCLKKRSFWFLGVSLIWCVTACTNNSIALDATTTTFSPLAEVVEQAPALQQQVVTTMGYLYVDSAGARLIDSISFSQDATPQPVSLPSEQIWISAELPSTLASPPQQIGSVQLAPVLARGRIEGPGNFGGDGAYQYRIVDPQLQIVIPQETTISVLSEQPSEYDNQLVRVQGGLLSSPTSAVLAEELGQGGIPDSQKHQIKLQGSIDDVAMLAQLQSHSDDTIYFGNVQVEGIWQQKRLIPLTIIPVIDAPET